MTKQEFKNTCKIRGIACQEICKNYIKKYDKTDYTDDDLIELYRIEQNTYWDINDRLRCYYPMDTDNYALIKEYKN